MKVKKTTEGLRDLLFQEIEDFLEGKVDSDHGSNGNMATERCTPLFGS